MNNPFDYVPDRGCDEAFRELIEKVEILKRSGKPEEINFCRELEAGKMLGVLIAEDTEGVRHTLYAFSGQLGEGGFHFPGFVGPVFDYLMPDGYFKKKETDISRQNIEIREFEIGRLSAATAEYERAKRQMDALIEESRQKYRKSKSERDRKRDAGLLTDTQLADMIRQSQFEKAELHRLKKRVAATLEPFKTNLKEAQSQLAAMKEKRHSDSIALQKWLFDNFKLLNAKGESRSLSDIFAETPLKTPPSGAGECCAPKLLQTAYLDGWRPLAIAEYWYGKSKTGEVRLHGNHYPACRGKCLPILSWMMEGLTIDPPAGGYSGSDSAEEPKIVFENRWFCVVDKPSGMLSVPGKTDAVSVQQWLEMKYGADRQVKVVHRLDQDTSGLLIATFGPLSFKVMQSLFARRRVRKTYIADLEGDYGLLGSPKRGRINLPLSPDWLDRPRQIIDYEKGKAAVTEYEFLYVKDGRSRVIFHPITGRTHQLRVHAASERGLGMPIAGDRLYGFHSVRNAPRLMLHAQSIEFTFPIDRHLYSFESPLPF